MGLISRVSSRTYRAVIKKQLPKSKMAVVKVVKAKVPEALAKKRSRYAKLAAANTAARAQGKRDNVVKRREIIKKARAYAAEYSNAAKALANNTKAAKAHGNYYVADEPRLAVVTRIRGINQISPKPKKVLQILRLRQIEQSLYSNAPNGRSIHCLGLSFSRNHQEDALQTRCWSNQRSTNQARQQLCHRKRFGIFGYQLHRRLGPRNLHRWPQ